MAAGPWTLKLQMEGAGDLRRCRIDGEEAPTYEVVLATATRLREGIPAARLAYLDEEGDVCTLNAASLPDALALAGPSRTLRLSAIGGASPEEDNGAAVGTGTDGAATSALPASDGPAIATLSEQLRQQIGGLREEIAATMGRSRSRLDSDRERLQTDASRLQEQLRTGVREGAERLREATAPLKRRLTEQWQEVQAATDNARQNGPSQNEVLGVLATATAAGAAVAAATRRAPLGLKLATAVGGAAVAATMAGAGFAAGASSGLGASAGGSEAQSPSPAAPSAAGGEEEATPAVPMEEEPAPSSDAQEVPAPATVHAP